MKLLQRNVRLWLERRRLGVIENNDEKRHKGTVSECTLLLRTTDIIVPLRNTIITLYYHYVILPLRYITVIMLTL